MKKNRHPPGWVDKFLRWRLPAEQFEEVQGDMHELYSQWVEEVGVKKARWLYILNALTFLRPLPKPRTSYSQKNKQYSQTISTDMFKHSLLLIYRSFRRFKSSFLINLIGLSSGLACTILIYLWVNDELNVDKFFEKDNHLYQVMEHKKQADGIITQTSTSGIMAQSLAEEMPEVAYAATVRLLDNDVTLSVGETQVKTNGRYVSKDFFKVFSYDFMEGNASGVLKDKNSIVISASLARKLFGTTQYIIGKPVEFQHEKQFVVSGIFKDIPANASDKFDFVLSFEGFSDNNDWVLTWSNEPVAAYVVLKPGTDIDHFNKKIANYVKIKSNNENSPRVPFIKRYSENYLYGKYENGMQTGGRIEYVRLFSVIALFILLIACINFMNLSTAKASRRMKEVGIKKAVGADRKALIFQFLGESLLMTSMSVILALILVALLLPEFNEITAKSLSLRFDSTLILSLLGITLFTGIIAGSYPALYLSGFSPAIVLKGKINSSVGELFARKGLVIFQFTLSIILIVSVLVVYQQTKFVQTKNLGYNKDNIIYFVKEGNTTDKANLETFLSEIKNIPGIVSASSIGHDMTGHNWSVYGFEWEGKDPNDNTSFENVVVYYDMMETLDIQMKEGRTFSRQFNADSTKIIFNEAAIAHMGLKDPVGKTIKLWGQNFQIIGVAKNFHFESLHEQIKPLLFRFWPERTNKFMVKIEAGKEKETISKLEEFYKNYNPGFAFDYKFLDEEYGAQYEAEKRVSTLSQYFAGLAILISCLGLFGLAAFTAERRRKEIGIRKVLGASELGIVRLLSGEFTRLVCISILFALPISFLITRQWLENFAFSIELSWWYFAAVGLIALFIAWITVGTQAIKAARINPIQTLRNE